MTGTDFREPSDFERQLFDKMMDCDVAGRDALKAQLETCMVRNIHKDGGLEIRATPPIAETKARVPVEGEAKDGDGVVIHFLLHVINGLASNLDIYKEDGSPIRQQPNIEAVQVWGC